MTEDISKYRPRTGRVIKENGSVVNVGDVLGELGTINVQHPVPTDGDSVYEKDVNVAGSDIGTFNGDIVDLFKGYTPSIDLSDTSATNPKHFIVTFNRPIETDSIGIGSATKKLSNVKILLQDQLGEDRAIVDQSSNDTKYSSRVYSFEPEVFIQARIEFHTADEIELTGMFITKDGHVSARIEAQKPDGTSTFVGATAGGNLKNSLEEFDTSFYTTPLPVADIDLEIAKGNIVGHSEEHKFGRNEAVGTALEVIAPDGIYQTPTTTVILEAISDDADDTAAGDGAQEITLLYLDSAFVMQTATIEMNGTTATTDIVAGVLRLLRVYVSRSGTYATNATASQQGTITIRVESAGAIWTKIPELGTTGFGFGQSLTGAYTVPAGKTMYILNHIISIDGVKVATLYFFKRENADDVSAPYSGIMRIQNIYPGLSGLITIPHHTYESYPEKTDVGWMATAPTPADITAEFEYILVDN